MNIGFLITARLKSVRLPRKILLPLNGYTAIERVIQRAKTVVDASNIVLCTSVLSDDVPLVQVAQENKIHHYKGHPDDVLQRLLGAAKKFRFDYVLGMTPDNPFFSIEYTNQIREMFQSDNTLDFVFTSRLPVGLNTYGINVKALETVCAVKEIVDTEIWGPLLERPDIFNVINLSVDHRDVRDNYRLTLDEIADYRLMKILYSEFEPEDIPSISQIYEILDKNEELSRTNSSVVQTQLDQMVLSEIETFFTTKRQQILDLKERIYNKN